MSVAKVLGIETEYGIAGGPDADQIVASSIIVNAYAQEGRTRINWDFEGETPDMDARGLPDLTSFAPVVETHLANTVLTNGARLYVDHAHPEYSSPECRTPLEATLYDAAGEEVMRRALMVANEMVEPHQAITLYKNNSDGKGNSYGTHENYLVSREVEFNHLVRAMVPHFVSRQIIIGAGKVGAETEAGLDGDPFFQLSSRAEFFEEVVGLETTLKRPIINTRDEPHADAERFRRLHVIIGDANMSQVATFVKLGSTALVARGVGGLRPSGPFRRCRDSRSARSGASRSTPASSTPCCARTTAIGRRGTSRTNCGTSRTTTWSEGRRRGGPARGGPVECFASGARCSTACATIRRPWPTGSTGWPNCGSFGAFRSATAWPTATRACTPSTCSTTTCAPSDPSPSASVCARCTARTKFVKRFTTHRKRRGPTSAASAWRATRTKSWRRIGIRSSSIWAKDRCNVCRCSIP